MSMDGLLIVNEVKEKGRIRNYYRINPKILESPNKDGDYFDSNESIFKIPLEMIEEDLTILEKCNKFHRMREMLFNSLDPDKEKFDYIMFLTHLRIMTAFLQKYDQEQFCKIGVKFLPLIVKHKKEIKNQISRCINRQC
jgi:hypothetical protein